VGAVSTSVEALRHRALADPSRLAILRVLEGAEGPLDVQALADAVGLHVNTVRWHLGILVDGALVTEARTPSGARGRPRHAYRIVPGALDDFPGGYRLLADVLAEVIARGGGPAAIEEVGRERGRELAGDVPAAGRERAVGAVVRLLEQFGFRPRVRRAGRARRIEMRPCPFGDTAWKHSAVVCPLHLGLMRGVLERTGGDVEATALEPFARPDVCVAHLEPRER
jgi:predicted ArsR family transcriptional regulator